jgi:hypothetical protein
MVRLPLIICLILSLFLLSNHAIAAEVTLTWNPNTDPDLLGYKVFSRTDDQNYDYNNPLWQGTESTCTISGLNEDTTNYFVVRAYNISGDESSNSNEVQYEILSELPTSVMNSLFISGPNLVKRDSTPPYTAIATFSDGTTQAVTGSASWSVNSDYPKIHNGVDLANLEIPSNQTATIAASYTVGDVTKTATKVVTIVDVLPTL